MSFLWGSTPKQPPENSPEGLTEKAARLCLTELFEKHDPSKVRGIDALIAANRADLSQMVTEARKPYAVQIRRDEIRTKLLKHYEKHNKDKVAIVDDMLARFAGREEVLLSEVLKKYPEPSPTDMPSLANARVASELNTSLPIPLQDKRIFYSGFLWEQTRGWLSSKQRRWCVLVAQDLFLGSDPMDLESALTKVSLVGATIADVQPDPAKDCFMFTITSADGVSHSLYTSNEVEKLMWAVKVDVAVLQANPSRQANIEARDMYQKVFTEYPLCPAIPHFADRYASPPEKLDMTLLTGYLISKTSDSWLGENWCRRYITLHSCYFTVRPDKKKTSGLQVHPLRDADMEIDKAKGFFSVWSDFIPCISIAPDTPEELSTWHTAFLSAMEACNPERKASKPDTSIEHVPETAAPAGADAASPSGEPAAAAVALSATIAAVAEGIPPEVPPVPGADVHQDDGKDDGVKQ